eukprot:s6738_g1.t1
MQSSAAVNFPNGGYVDACKIVKGLEPKFGNFVTKAAVIPDAGVETKQAEEETKEQKEFQKLQGEIELYKAKLRTDFGYSNKDIKADPDVQEMESRISAFKRS